MTHANVIALRCVIDTLEDGSYHPVSGGPIARLASSNQLLFSLQFIFLTFVPPLRLYLTRTRSLRASSVYRRT